MLTKGDADESIREVQGGRDNGGGMLMVFTDGLPEAGEDIDRWHNEEHVPERLLIPGVLNAVRN